MLDLTPVLRKIAQVRLKRLNSQDPAEVQERQLLKLVKKASQTRFGNDYDFSSIKSVSDYQRRVPLRTYEQFWNDYWKSAYPNLVDCTWPGRIPFFPLSSGTSSGTTKYIPCSNEMMRSNNRAGLDLLCYHAVNRPQSKIFGGKSFMLGGSTDLEQQLPGVFAGDLSGIATKSLPFWAKSRFFPPAKIALLKDWEQKISVLSELSLKEDIRTISGVPSWMLIFFDHIAKLRPESEGQLAKIFPNLEMIVHGGVNFAPYREQFERRLAGSRAELREVYPASEGFIAIADRGSGEGLRMNLSHGLFFEFVPVEELSSINPTRHWIETAQPGINYAIVLTTCAGLWSYVLGDTVRITDQSPTRLLVTGRTSYSLSAFGEHVIGEEVEDAVTHAGSSLGITFNDFTVGPVFPKNPGELGGHLYVIEATDRVLTPEEITKCAALIDQRLSLKNEDYKGHRAEGFGLRTPEIRSVMPGTFKAWMKSRGKLGGQNKVPRIITKPELLEDLLKSLSSSG